MKQLPLFVYGTLRPGATNYKLLRHRVVPGRTVKAVLQGYQMFTFGLFPGIFPDPYGESVGPIQGDLLWLDSSCYAEALADIDLYEGEGRIFFRHALGVQAGQERREEVAWVYLVGLDLVQTLLSTRVESNDWFRLSYED